MKRLTLLAVCFVTAFASAASFAGVHFGVNFASRPMYRHCRPVYVSPRPCYVVQRPCYVACCHPVRRVHKVCHAPRPRVGFNFDFGF